MILSFFRNLFADLYRQPLRTFLTLSGVVWGTFAIILLLAFGDGLGKSVRKSMHGMGEGIVIVWPGVTTMSYKGITKGRQIRMTPEAVMEIKDRVPNLRRVSPEFRRSCRVRYKKEEYNNVVRGVNPEFGIMRNEIPASGRFLDPLDIQHNRRVCFLGFTIAENLFHEEDPVGKKVLVEGMPFTVIGVMKKKIQNSDYSGGRDEFNLFIPYTTFRAVYGNKYVNNLMLQPELGRSKPVIAALRDYLGNKIGFDPKDNDALFIWDFTEMEQSLETFFLAFRIFLGLIGSFTLLVGAVGVASIMLVVVEERIREIGVKLAVGAKRKQILRQFFSESLAIILLGGLIGFGLAALLLGILPMDKISDFVGYPRINVTVSVATILVLVAVGSVAGLMPARKAASTDPIEALRG
jgi:putative ABC transport system permease protein